MYTADTSLSARLASRALEGNLRKLSVPAPSLSDFCSNDYLGFATSGKLNEVVLPQGGLHTGATGSRLISGNFRFTEDLENFIAAFHKAESGLIYNSGYDANVGLFSSVPQKGDTVIYDELAHASIRDGLRMGRAQTFAFRHNDLADLEEKLKQGKGHLFVAVLSVYSMDGDYAPLEMLCEVCARYDASLIVDEAHATGIYGPEGEGRVVELGLQDQVYARVHTFGKAIGCHGAIVLGTNILKEYLINFSRSFIYTTALPLHSLSAVRSAYQLLAHSRSEVQKLKRNIDLFKQCAAGRNLGLSESDSPIQSLYAGGNDRVKTVEKILANAGYFAKAIMSPTVPRGKERIRICIHSFNTEQEITGLVKTLAEECLKMVKLLHL